MRSRSLKSSTTLKQRQVKFAVQEAKAFAEEVLHSYSALLPMNQKKITVEVVEEIAAGRESKDVVGMADVSGGRLLLRRSHVEQDSMTAVKDTILHELAHFLMPFSQHGLDWRETALELGVRDIADLDDHRMGYGLDVCWRRAKKVGVRPRPAYTAEVWRQNQASLRAAGYERRGGVPKYVLEDLSREEAIDKLAKGIRAALAKRQYALIGRSGKVYARSKDSYRINRDKIVFRVTGSYYLDDSCRMNESTSLSLAEMTLGVIEHSRA